jgi:uncharacterized protein
VTAEPTLPRATIDTNVLVVAPINASSPPGIIYDAWQAGRFELVISQQILDEVDRTHQKTYFQDRLSPSQIQRLYLLLRNQATLIQITVSVQGVATHPEDDLILATAVSGNVDYLVTGDERLRFRVPTYRGIRVVSPAQFVTLLGLTP